MLQLCSQAEVGKKLDQCAAHVATRQDTAEARDALPPPTHKAPRGKAKTSKARSVASVISGSTIGHRTNCKPNQPRNSHNSITILVDCGDGSVDVNRAMMATSLQS